MRESSASTPRTLTDGGRRGGGTPRARTRTPGAEGARSPLPAHALSLAHPRPLVARVVLRVAHVLAAEDVAEGTKPRRRLRLQLALADLQGRLQPLSHAVH